MMWISHNNVGEPGKLFCSKWFSTSKKFSFKKVKFCRTFLQRQIIFACLALLYTQRSMVIRSSRGSGQNTYHFFLKLPSFFILLRLKVVSREHRMQLTSVSLDRVEKLETNTSLTICFLWCFCSLLKSLAIQLTQQQHMVFARHQ